MKKIIISAIALCLIGVTGFGQTIDSIYWDRTQNSTRIGIGDNRPPSTALHVFGDTYIINDSTTKFHHDPTAKLNVNKEPPKPYIDTISVLMLVCDTLQIKDITYHMNNQQVVGWCFWMKGYEVRKHYWAYHPDYILIEEKMAIGHVAYLGTDKKLLNKNIVVWEVKKIK